MKSFLPLLSVLTAAVLSSCGTSRTSFTPENGPPTVGMPAELSERERVFVKDLDSSLRDEGYLPVRHGAGDMQLEFQMDEGPINIDTSIELLDGRRVIAKGSGRAAGAPLIGRSKVAEKSFGRAFEQFKSSLPGNRRGNSYDRDATGSPNRETPSAPQPEGSYVY